MSRSNGQGPSLIASQRQHLESLRNRMVEEQLVRRGIRDERVLEVMRRLERHRFVPAGQLARAYGDHPIPIGSGQTLSQPYIVAVMTEALALIGTERVLEIGTGSGYQTAVLAELAAEVYTVELVQDLADTARERVKRLGYENVAFRTGDGREGWPRHAPYDGILVAASPESLPLALRDQLGAPGRLVIPVGPAQQQELELHMKTANGRIDVRRLGAVRFVPLI